MPGYALKTKQALDILRRESAARARQQQSLSDARLDEALADGDICGPFYRVEGDNSKSLFFEVTTYYMRFRKGDVIEFRIPSGEYSQLACNDLTIKQVTYPTVGKIRIEVTKKKDFSPDSTTGFFAYPKEATFVDYKLREEISKCTELSLPSPQIFRVNLRSDLLSNLNPSQQDAVRIILDQGVNGCIQGPPGTGKTQVLVALVAHCLAAGLRVGLTAFTNTAVDNALARIVSVLKISSFARCGRKEKINFALYPNADMRDHLYPAISSVPSSCQLIANTTHAWALSSPIKIDVMIVDEAGQVASFLSPLLMRLAPNFILLGDDRQLPPVLTARHGSDVTDFFSLGRQAYNDVVPMLTTQYRMNKDIQSWSSARFYDGLLKPDQSVFDRDILGDTSADHELGHARVQLRTYQAPMFGRASSLEADFAVRMIKAALRKGISPDAIGVIAPHRIQAGAVCAQLQEQLDLGQAQAIQVDTVERFQGQEKEVIVFSAGHAFDKSRVESDDEKVAFLSDARRLNVAVTRAKSRFICFAGQALISESVKAKGKGAVFVDFIDWCGASPSAPLRRIS